MVGTNDDTNAATATKWQIKTVPRPAAGFNSGRFREEDELNALLNTGWEPFAATQAGPRTGVLYHLRRQVETGSSTDA